MNALQQYYRLQLLSFSRYLKTFPIWFLVIAGIFILSILVLFYRIQIDGNNIRITTLVMAAYIIISLSLSIKKTEKTLLNNYKVPIRYILLIQYILLSIPFFIINWKIGCFCLLSGILIALLKPVKVDVKSQLLSFKPTYFFKKESYQWYSFYRLVGFYIHCAGIFLIINGLIYDNSTLSLFALIFIGVAMGIGSLLSVEPSYYVRIYNSPKQLIQKKSIEIVYNVLMIQLPLALVLLFFHVKLWFVSYSVFSTLVLCWITFAVKYSRYPDAVTTQLLLFLVILPLTIFCLVSTPWMLFGVLLIALVLYYFLWTNLQQVFYQIEKNPEE